MNSKINPLNIKLKVKRAQYFYIFNVLTLKDSL